MRNTNAGCGFAGWTKAFIGKLLLKAERRRTVNMLSRMDDRYLKDIGLSRADIHHVAVFGTRPDAI